MQLPTLTTTQSIVSITVGLLVVAGVLWRALRPRSDDAVCDSMERREARIKAWLESPAMFGPAIAEHRNAIQLTREIAGKVQAIEHATDGLPKEVGRLADAVDRFEGAAAGLANEIAAQRREFTRDLMQHGREVSELRGAFDTWNGQERRRTHGRRAEDQHE